MSATVIPVEDQRLSEVAANTAASVASTAVGCRRAQ
jgi:hypothetical protein